MKRKTNLFYTSGPDSKFLTFSNYGESLTGNFLSVNTKIFPSRILCLSINNLNQQTKQAFIRYLVAYYENKLAFLRDNVNEKEPNLSPISYLLEAIVKVLFLNAETNTYQLVLNESEKDLEINPNSSLEILNKINIYSSEITEQDYNGIYSDIICTVDLSSIHKCKIKYDNISYILKQAQDTSETLYGWNDNVKNILGYENIKPIYDVSNDDENLYNINSNIESILFNKLDSDVSEIKFNVIIPLYEVVNIDYNSNDTILGYDEYDSTSNTYILTVNGANKYTHNVPLGIWINAEGEEDTNVTVYKDSTTGYSPVWSLMISSQFKPFPYSSKYENELNENNLTDKQAAFNTFTQVITRLNKVLDSFDNINKRLTTYENRLNEIQSIINNFGTLQSIDTVNAKMVDLENNVKEQLKDLKTEVKESLENIKWKFQ